MTHAFDALRKAFCTSVHCCCWARRESSDTSSADWLASGSYFGRCALMRWSGVIDLPRGLMRSLLCEPPPHSLSKHETVSSKGFFLHTRWACNY